MSDVQNTVPDGTPDDVAAYARAGTREPASDPTLGVPVEVAKRGEPRHRLVTIGDSLTHGFQSGAVFRTELSWPAIVAYELGWFGEYRFPRYPGPVDGLPLNLEFLLRGLQERYGPDVALWEVPFAGLTLRHLMDQVEDYWERGPGATYDPVRTINHDLAVFGWKLREPLEKTAKGLRDTITTPSDDAFAQVVENATARAALRVYPGWDEESSTMTLVDAARALGAEHDDGTDAGIETLVVFLGANNVLPAVTNLAVRWTGDPGDPTVWRPADFVREFDALVEAVSSVQARHVIWCTVPHVTVAPVARGVGGRLSRGSRYYHHYTRPWVEDDAFRAGRDRSITGEQAWVLDAAVDMYNDHVTGVVENARRQQRDWYLLDIAMLLDRLAQRRFQEDAEARPPWWTAYQMPAALTRLDPVPNSRFLGTGPDSRRDRGGLFSLDGVHPTTVGYGIIAREVMKIMAGAGVEFRTPAGVPRPGVPDVDFDRLIAQDTLLTPPSNIGSVLGVVGLVDETLGVFGRSLPF